LCKKNEVPGILIWPIEEIKPLLRAGFERDRTIDRSRPQLDQRRLQWYVRGRNELYRHARRAFRKMGSDHAHARRKADGFQFNLIFIVIANALSELNIDRPTVSLRYNEAGQARHLISIQTRDMHENRIPHKLDLDAINIVRSTQTARILDTDNVRTIS